MLIKNEDVMMSVGAIFPNRRPSNLPFIGRNQPPNLACKSKREMNEIHDYKSNEGRKFSILLHFHMRSCVCFIFRRAGAFCRFVGHVRDLIVSLSRDDKESDLSASGPQRPVTTPARKEMKNTTRMKGWGEE